MASSMVAILGTQIRISVPHHQIQIGKCTKSLASQRWLSTDPAGTVEKGELESFSFSDLTRFSKDLMLGFQDKESQNEMRTEWDMRKDKVVKYHDG